VRIIQRCPVYAGSLSKAMQDDPSQFLILEHENGIAVDDSVRRLFPNRQAHDPSDLAKAFALAHDASRMPIGLLYHNPDAPCYEDMSSKGVGLTSQERLDGLNKVLDRITI
jgi:2-oxoglutarate ferredoxin oxidoreductase subunit beta